MLAEIIYNNIKSKTNIIVGNITGNILHPHAPLAIEQNGCQHKIFPYVQYRYRWTKFKGLIYQMGLSLNSDQYSPKYSMIGTYPHTPYQNNYQPMILFCKY